MTNEQASQNPKTAPEAQAAPDSPTPRQELAAMPNHRDLLDAADDYLGDDVYVVLCDLDNFRLINEVYGEDVADGFLANVGKAIQRNFGVTHVFRYGSDEFLIVNEFFDEDSFLEKLDALDRMVDAISHEGKRVHLAMSYGYAHGKIADGDDLHEAVRFADRKMYEAKRLGKGRAVGSSLEGDPLITAGGRTHGKAFKSYETDELTGLANLVFFRGQLELLLEHQAEQARSAEEAEAPEAPAAEAPAQEADDEPAPDPNRIALVYFNVQNFKGYNEKYGFDAGDELLILIGSAIKSAFPHRLAARFSADQFMVVATVGSAEEGIMQVRQAFRKKQKDSSIWLKAGIYIPADEDDNIGVVMDRPKLACDSIKGRRDVFFCYYDRNLQRKILLNRYVLENFDRALRENWAKVFYQPIVRVATGEVCDEEALARWVDPDKGIISPADFIPVLEEARLIHKLDLYIVRRVCQNLARAQADNLGVTPVSVNLSRLDFELCDIVSEIEAIVEEYGVKRRMLSIEVTESALAGNQEFLKAEIDRFRADGFEVWMDDFGSGYSSLHLLKEYNFDLVKIDMGFLTDFEGNEQARIMLAHIVSMCKELGLKTLVEGVETDEQCEFLRAIGCGRAQGYFFGRPCSAKEVELANEEGSYLPLELPDRHHFYEAVGRVNLLRPDPFEPIDGHYVPGDIPVAVLRRHQGVYEYLNVSDVYRVFLKSMGVNSIEESTDRLNDGTRVERIRLQESIDTCIKSGEWEWATYYENGKYCSMRVKCIANHPEEDAVAVMIVAVNVQQSSHITPL